MTKIEYAKTCTGEGMMLSSPEKDRFDDKGKEAFGSSFGEKDRISNGIKKRDVLSVDSSPIRKEKVKEAKRKKQNGEYDSQEVYKKIADKLIDLFGM